MSKYCLNKQKIWAQYFFVFQDGDILAVPPFEQCRDKMRCDDSFQGALTISDSVSLRN